MLPWFRDSSRPTMDQYYTQQNKTILRDLCRREINVKETKCLCTTCLMYYDSGNNWHFSCSYFGYILNIPSGNVLGKNGPYNYLSMRLI